MPQRGQRAGADCRTCSVGGVSGAEATALVVVDVLSSVSRVMDLIVPARHRDAARKLRGLLATWQENEELIRLGAYKAGSSAAVDGAVARIEPIRAWLGQAAGEGIAFDKVLSSMEAVCK